MGKISYCNNVCSHITFCYKVFSYTGAKVETGTESEADVEEKAFVLY